MKIDISKIDVAEIFSPETLDSLHSEWLASGRTPDRIFYRIKTKLFNDLFIANPYWMKCSTPEVKDAYHDLFSLFCKCQAEVFYKETLKSYAQLGQTPPEGKRLNDKTMVRVPLYDPSQPAIGAFLTKKFDEPIDIDYSKLRGLTTSDTSFEKMLELIRALGSSFKFEEGLDIFVKRFALLVCNAKAKALGEEPAFPIMFNFVGSHGQGKSFLVNQIRSSYDDTFCTNSSPAPSSLFTSNFNAVMATRGFVTLEEFPNLDKASRERLKQYVTAGSISYELKGKDVSYIQNLTTIIASTNRSMKAAFGLEQDRRLVEVAIESRIGSLPSVEDIQALLKSIWLAAPTKHPDPRSIIDELYDESYTRVSEESTDIAIALFEDPFDIMSGKFISKTKAREKFRNIAPNRIFDDFIKWCVKDGVLTLNNSGRLYLVNRRFKAIVDEFNTVTVPAENLQTEVSKL